MASNCWSLLICQENTKTAIALLQKKIQVEIMKARQTKSIEALSKLESYVLVV
jgi:hypothetical protein